MRREGYLFEKVISMDNLIRAYKKSRRKKKKTYGVRLFDRARGCNLIQLHNELASGMYRTPEYSIFTVFEPKERQIYRLPYRDRIVHHAIMNVMEKIWVSVFTADTYSCIKGRGIHKAVKKVKKVLASDPEGTRYALKIDVKKFYPSIDHGVLKAIIRKRIKCPKLLALLDEIIDSAPGVPIGNYLSQYFANLYLAYFDHQAKEKLGVAQYFRYADDIVVMSGSKNFLHGVLRKFREGLDRLKLRVKENYQVFPISARGLDFVGYVFRHTHTLLRKSIKQSWCRKVSKGYGYGSNSWWSYYGWAIHCDGRNLIKKLINDEIKQNTHAAT